MSIYSTEILIDNKLSKKGDIVLKETREVITKIFGITLKKGLYKRDTEKLDIDILAQDGTMGFKKQ